MFSLRMDPIKKVDDICGRQRNTPSPNVRLLGTRSIDVRSMLTLQGRGKLRTQVEFRLLVS